VAQFFLYPFSFCFFNLNLSLKNNYLPISHRLHFLFSETGNQVKSLSRSFCRAYSIACVLFANLLVLTISSIHFKRSSSNAMLVLTFLLILPITPKYRKVFMCYYPKVLLDGNMGYNSMAVKRELKGIDIVKNGSVMQIDTSRFRVRSQSDSSRWYEVSWQRNHWNCECADYAKHRTKCKHIHAVNYYLTVKDIVLLARRIYSNICCPVCGHGDKIIKKGVRYNRSGSVQLYLCKRCRRKFTATTGLGRMKRKARIIAVALDLYYRGLSLRQVG